MGASSSGSIEEEKQISEIIVGNGFEWMCKACGKTTLRRDNLKRHVQSMHLPSAIRCGICKLISRSLQAFHTHMKRKHNIRSMRDMASYQEDPEEPKESLEIVG